ncbi:MAG: DNA adenine methylase [Elusimicrobiaceae bacterium]|nr:DNA adenine methylase [Elusimicrobiaceae bacterium]
MNYIGSKLSLLKFIDESISKVVDTDCHTFCDLFAGTGAVGRHFKEKGYSIIANDMQYYSFVLNKQYIANHRPLAFSKLTTILPSLKKVKISERSQAVCEYLTNITGKKGFIYKNYSSEGTAKKTFVRNYFSSDNAQKCDAIRQQIETWRNKKLITENEYYFLLASLIESVDKSANTASVYGAFLKKLKQSALRPLILRPANLLINEQEHQVFQEDANMLIKHIRPDILYLDPPYNTRQYATNYHLLETIAKYDNPKIYGKTGLRDYTDQKSSYCSRSTVKKAFADLIKNAKTKYIFLSYNNEGLLSLADIKEIFEQKGTYGYFTQTYNRFKADRNRDYKASNTTEYIHYCICK